MEKYSAPNTAFPGPQGSLFVQVSYNQIRSFHAVASAGGFTAASKVLHVGQPTITGQVQALESFYGVELFHRRGRRVELTETGRELFAVTQHMEILEKEAQEVLQSAGGFKSGHLRIGAVGPFHVTEMLAVFHERYPDLKITVTVRNSHEILESLLGFEVDAAVLSQTEEDPRLLAIPFCHEPLVVFVHAEHPWAERDSLKIEELEGQPVILREPGSETRLAFENALGNFKNLLFAIAKSASMINYLHLKQNKKGKANEDFARELCELFTLGRDVDYTEQDVSEIARAFTGWRTDDFGKHIIIEKQHDSGEKTIFGKTGNFGGEDVLNMILENRHTSDFIVTKVYRFFVRENINQRHIEELSKVFFESNYNITTLMKHLFLADWFYESKGQLIKGPIEFMVGLGKIFELKFPHRKAIEGIQHYLGQVLFDPPNVAGWAGGRQWIDASRFALRLRLGSLILNRGYVMDELNPELDEMIAKKQKKKDFKFYETIEWDAFWKKNKDTNIFDLLIRNENNELKENHNEADVKTIIHLISTPDFQLI